MKAHGGPVNFYASRGMAQAGWVDVEVEHQDERRYNWSRDLCSAVERVVKDTFLPVNHLEVPWRPICKSPFLESHEHRPFALAHDHLPCRTLSPAAVVCEHALGGSCE